MIDHRVDVVVDSKVDTVAQMTTSCQRLWNRRRSDQLLTRLRCRALIIIKGFTGPTPEMLTSKIFKIISVWSKYWIIFWISSSSEAFCNSRREPKGVCCRGRVPDTAEGVSK